MIIHDVAQGSAEWHALRIGIPTASSFDQVITPAKLEKSKSSRPYAFRLAAERLLQRPTDDFSKSAWMERGKALEPAAAAAYEFINSVKTRRVGFLTTDDGKIGASPDRLIGDGGLLEIKVPAPHTHLSYLIDGFGDAYKIQAMGQLLIADDRDYVVRFSYSEDPEIPHYEERAERDEKTIGRLRDALAEFCDEVDRIVAQAIERGAFRAARRVPTPAEVAYGDQPGETDELVEEARSRFLHTILSAEAIEQHGTTLPSG